MVAEIRQLIQHAPELISVMGGDLSLRSEQRLISRLSGSQLAMKESLAQKLEQLRESLSGSNPSPVDRMLVERVVTCWLHVQFADLQLIERDDVTLKLGEYLQRQQDRAHRRFLSAVRTLTTVRRLASPIQVDVKLSATNHHKSAQ